jgi:DNA gyrase subunit A
MDILPSVSDKKGFRHLLVATQNGVGKRNDVYLYPLQKRGGVGVKVANLSKNTSQITAAQVVTQTHDQVFLVSKKGVTIKLPLKNIPVLKNRNTRGVILMRFKSDDDALATLTALETLEQGSAPQK